MIPKITKRSIADWYKLWDTLDLPHQPLTKEEREIAKAAKLWKVAKDEGIDKVLIWKLANA